MGLPELRIDESLSAAATEAMEEAMQEAMDVPSLAPAHDAAGILSGEAKRFAQAVVDDLGGGQASISMLPAAATKIMRLAQDPSASLKDFDRAVKHEPGLLARVFQAASSPLYGGGSKVRSLRQAMAMLGMDRLRNVLMQSIVEAHMLRGSRGRLVAGERQHAIAVAHLSDWIAKESGQSRVSAFTAGLLHDIGRLIIPGLAERLAPRASNDVISTVVDALHAPIGAFVAHQWDLPPEVVRVAATHHDPVCQLGHIVAFADAATQTMHLSETGSATSEDDPSAEQLGLSEDQLEDLWLFLIELGNDVA